MGRKFKKVREDELCEMKKGEGEIVKKYEERLAEHTDAGLEDVSKFSSEYEKFRAEALSERLSWYESWCGLAENLLRFKPNQKDLPELERAVATAHLQVTPAGAASFAALVAFLFILLGVGVCLRARAFSYAFVSRCALALESKQPDGAVHVVHCDFYAPHIKS